MSKEEKGTAEKMEKTENVVRIMEILSRECGIPLEEICKNNPDSRIIVGTNKDRL